MKRTLVLAFAAVLVAIVAGCGGGGGESPSTTPTPTPTPKYGALSQAIGSECAFMVGAVSIGSGFQSSVSSAARSTCQAEADKRAQAAGISSPSCMQPRAFEGCAAFAVGEDTAGACYIAHAAGGSRSGARQTAREYCEGQLESGASCEDLNSACTSESASPPVGVWTPSPDAADDHSDSLADATVAAVGATLSGRIDSPADEDYFRLQVSETGTLTVWTTGEVATDLTLLDSAGNDLRSGYPPSGLGTQSVSVNSVITTSVGRNVSSREIAVRAGATVIAKVAGRADVGSYTFGEQEYSSGPVQCDHRHSAAQHFGGFDAEGRPDSAVRHVAGDWTAHLQRYL